MIEVHHQRCYLELGSRNYPLSYALNTEYWTLTTASRMMILDHTVSVLNRDLSPRSFAPEEHSSRSWSKYSVDHLVYDMVQSLESGLPYDLPVHTRQRLKQADHKTINSRSFSPSLDASAKFPSLILYCITWQGSPWHASSQATSWIRSLDGLCIQVKNS